MAVTAKVAVEAAAYSFDRCYDYGIPPHLAERVKPGSMVLVPFGMGKAKPRMGVVLDVGEPEYLSKGLKNLYDAVPEEATLTPELLGLVGWLKEHTFCTYYEAVRAIIPYGAQYRAEMSPAGPILSKRLNRQTVSWYRLICSAAKLTAKQQKVADLLQSGEMRTAAELCELAGVTRGVVETMVRNGVLEAEVRERDVPVYEDYRPITEKVQLSADQWRSYTQLAEKLDAQQAQTALLHGVTGSGKTLIFVELIRKAVEDGKQCLVLVPEIGLTPQMVYRLKSAFGERVAVQHSALSNSERLDQWQQIQQGKADIVVGTRSAVFAPLERLGLIIIDEEQEHTYASETSPRYSAIEVAKYRAAYHKGLLLLASATPLCDDYYAAEQGRYTLSTLSARYNQQPLPSVELVDLRQELAHGNTGSISGRLAQEIARNLREDKQTILLLNRRGYQTVAMCESCGEVVKCKLCSVPMVYHKKENKLLCHYCGSTIAPKPEQCPDCSGKLRYTGFGTQRVEEELANIFPTARVLRLDTDTTQTKNSHERMLADFAAGRYDIMIGTQMVAKGLDFPNVSLVGVLGIDQMLFAQSYRAFERVFSLVTQVVGRSGRADAEGRALIQTVDPQNRILQLAAGQNYTEFYIEEIAARKLHLYPPFCAICVATFSAESEKETAQAAQAFANSLRSCAAAHKTIPLRVLGPAPAALAMLGGRYRYKLTVKCRNDVSFRRLLSEVLAEYHKGPFGGKVSLAVDFNNDNEA